jgi:hypothetical protein
MNDNQVFIHLPYRASNGAFAGPLTTSPLHVKRDPWIGQSNDFSSLFQQTIPFKCLRTQYQCHQPREIQYENARADSSHLVDIPLLTLVDSHWMYPIANNSPLTRDQILDIRDSLRSRSEPLGIIYLIRQVLLEVIRNDLQTTTELGMLS